MVTPTERDPLDAFLERSALQGKIQTMLQQGGLQWAPSHLLLAMVVGTVAGGFFFVLSLSSAFLIRHVERWLNRRVS